MLSHSRAQHGWFSALGGRLGVGLLWDAHHSLPTLQGSTTPLERAAVTGQTARTHAGSVQRSVFSVLHSVGQAWDGKVVWCGVSRVNLRPLLSPSLPVTCRHQKPIANEPNGLGIRGFRSMSPGAGE